MKFKAPFLADKYIEKHGEYGDFDPLPAGTYEAQITSVDEQVTKNNDGEMFVTVFSVSDGEGGDRNVRDWAIFKHKHSASAVENGMKRFASMCVAAGLPSVSGTDQLLGRRLLITLKIDGTFNKVAAYEQMPTTTQPQQPQPQPQQSYQPPPPPQQPPQEHPDMDDDLPF